MITRLTLAASALLITPVALAQQDPAELNPVIITATRTAQTVDASLSAVTVITAADIARLQPQSLTDLFAGLPGISISNNGGQGKITSVFLRGTSASELLVMIDGIKVGSATAGTTPFEQIPVDQIERIEIVRGPRSSLYGSDAIGGVIQIFTRKGAGALTPSFSVTGGTYDTWESQGGLSGSVGNAWYSGSISALQTKGINATTSDYIGYEPDADGYRNYSGSLRGGYRFDDGAELSMDWLRIYGHNHFDAYFPADAFYPGSMAEQDANENANVTQILGGTAKLPKFGIWQSSFSLGQAEDKEHDFGGNYGGIFNTLRNTAGWQNDFAFEPRQELTAGVDYLKDHVFSNTPYTGTSRENVGGFAQYQGGFGKHDVQLSLRDDHNQQFGTHWTGSAAWGYDFSRDLRATASYGSAFRAPTFNDLYYPPYAPGIPASDPNLRPEKSVSGEIGLSGRPGFWNWSLNAYQTNVTDLIVLDDTTYLPSNASRSRLRGVEGQFGLRTRRWSGQLYLDYLDPRDRTSGGSNHILTRRAAQTVRIDVDREFGRFSVGGSVNASSRTFYDDANTVILGGYATADLRAGWNFLPHWGLQARLSNVFDKHYETVQDFNQAGRAVYFTLRYLPSKS